MNKLQLYIYKSLRGFKSVRNINPSEGVQRHIREMRHALDVLDYDANEKYLFYLIRYVDEGTFFTILRTIPDKPADHLATTIFVPNGLVITPEEMSDIVKRTTRMISNPSVTADELTDLHETFSREYPVDAAAPATVPSDGREFAVVYYGGSTGRRLEDYFGTALYQPHFLKYAGVILVDSALGVSAHVADETSFVPEKTVSFLPPETSPDGFVPHIYHRHFDRAYRVPLGGSVAVTWRRGGFEDRVQNTVVTADGQRLEPIALDGSRKAISPASFYITSQSSKAGITGATIVVNGVEITESHTFTNAELKNADVTISAKGYFSYRGHLDLAATTQALIQLVEQRRIYRFELPVVSSELGAPIRFEIHTKRDLADSPIEGYALLDDIKEGSTRINHLEYTGTVSWKNDRRMLLAAVGALLVGFLLGWLIMGGSGNSEEESGLADTLQVTQVDIPVPAAVSKQTPAPKQAEKPVTEPAKAETPKAVSVSDGALKYLDANKLWVREELEKQGLKGLFEDMNSYQFERIISVWGPKLSKSKHFASVVKAAEERQHKKKFTPGAGDTYCKSGDTSINWLAYTYRIDP